MPTDNRKNLQAIILATGETEKLHPLTENMPAPMVPVANQPAMLYTIELLARYGLENVYVCVHRLAANIESYFREGYRWGLKLQYILQRKPLGTAGSIKLAQPKLDGPFIVLQGDVILDLDINAVLEQHVATQSVATVVDHSTQQNCAVILELAALDHIPARTEFDIFADLLPRLAEAGLKISRYEINTPFYALHSFPEYQAAQEIFLRNQAYHHHLAMAAHEIGTHIWSGRKTAVHSKARLTPPILIGHNCRIGRGVELGPDVVIGNDVFIDDEATVQHSTVLDGTYIGRLVDLQHRIVHGSLVIDITSGQHVKIEDDFIVSDYKKSVELGLRRLLHLSLALILLLLLSPVLLILGLAAWLTTGTPVRRVEYAKRSSPAGKTAAYELWRFSTVRDEKSTAFGRWLEAWDLHHLPALWNVVTGELVLVGLKPMLPQEMAEARNEAWEFGHVDYAPGFTGLWYVQNTAEADLLQHLVADAYYAATRSWQLDFRILARTPLGWVRRTVGKDSLLNKQRLVSSDEDF